MKRPAMPPEIDEMLWVAAESHDEAVAQEFERRYPQYRAELAKRRAMLEALRKARPREAPLSWTALPSKGERMPRFSPLRFWWVPLSAVFLIGVAVASYWLAKGLLYPTAGRAPDEGVSSLPETFPLPNKPTGEMQAVPQTPRDAQPPGSVPRPFTPPPGAPRVVLPVQGLSLHQALQEVSKQAKVAIMIMPDVPEMTLDLVSLLGSEPPTGTLNMTLEEAILLLEKVAPIRFLDNGTEGYVVLPLEKVQNVPSSRDWGSSGEKSSEIQGKTHRTFSRNM